jgi:hypothetical protein
VAAGHLFAGTDTFSAKLRFVARAPFAPAAGMLHPRDADAIADLPRSDTRTERDDFADGLVPERAWKVPREFAAGLMYIGKAEAAGVYLDQHLIRAGIGCVDLSDFPLAVSGRDDGCFHSFSPRLVLFLR